MLKLGYFALGIGVVALVSCQESNPPPKSVAELDSEQRPLHQNDAAGHDGQPGHVGHDHKRRHETTRYPHAADHANHGADPHLKQGGHGSKHHGRRAAHGAHGKPGSDRAGPHNPKGSDGSGTTKQNPKDMIPDGPLDDADALAVFNRRILPILQAKRPSSCTECHLSGVELKDYIQPDQAKTFASLQKQGLIDVQNPDESKILQFIRRQPEKPTILSQQVRQQELRAFQAWIRAAVKEPQLLKAEAGEELVGTDLPVEVVRHARKDRVLRSFIDNIWSEMGRCINCHSPDRNQRQVRKFGEQVSWIVPSDPAATLQQLVDGENINVEEPEKSPVLEKPAGVADHGGGPKFIVGGRTYKQFLTFLEDYSAVVKGRYKRASDLPKPAEEIAVPTEQHLRIIGFPGKYGDMSMRVDLYRWLGKDKGWSKERWATADGRINSKRLLFQSIVAVVAPRDTARAKGIRKIQRLPDGRYLAKLYIDKQGKLQKNPGEELAEAEFVGQVELAGSWPPGYQPPKIVQAPRLR